MEYQKVSVEVKGVAPLLMHNVQLANPLNPVVKEMKKITAKKSNKTDADLEDLSRLEFLGGAYINDEGTPIITGEIIEATIRNGARKTRRGKDVEAGLLCDGDWPLIYEGPKTIGALWDDKRFVDVRGVGVQKNKIMRTRPKFSDWSLKFEIEFLPELCNFEELKEWIETAGRFVGFCDYRPKFGRFIVVKCEKI